MKTLAIGLISVCALVLGGVAYLSTYSTDIATPPYPFSQTPAASEEVPAPPAPPLGAPREQWVKYFRAWMDERPDSVEAHEAFLKYLETNGNEEEREAMRTALKLAKAVRQSRQANHSPSRNIFQYATDRFELQVADPESPEKVARKQEALEFHRRRIEKNPDSAEFHEDYGRELLMQKEYGEAERELQEALRLDPQRYGVKELLESLNESASEDPLARSLAALGADLKTRAPLPELEPFLLPGETREDVEARANESNRREEQLAREKYGHLVKYRASHEEQNRIHLMMRYSWEQDWESADRQYERLKSEYPNSPELHAHYIEILSRRGRIQEALSLLNQQAPQHPRNAQLMILSDALRETGHSTDFRLFLYRLRLDALN